MKPADREGFQRIIREARARGLTLTAAIELAHKWLLLPRAKAHGANR